jgi:hypothetical protein
VDTSSSVTDKVNAIQSSKEDMHSPNIIVIKNSDFVNVYMSLPSDV